MTPSASQSSSTGTPPVGRAVVAAAPSSSGGGLSVRWVLVLSVLLITVPAWSFASYMSWRFAVTERQVIEAAGRSMASSVAGAIDFRLTSIESAMATLGLSPAYRSGDLAAFHRDAQALAQTQGIVIALVSPTGRQILNTNAPHGATLPDSPPEVRYAEAASTGKTQFSPMILGNVTGRWLVTITRPIAGSDGQNNHLLVAGIEPSPHLGSVLDRIDKPASWTVAVLDENNIIAARRPADERLIGEMAHPDIHGVVTSARTGSGRGRTQPGEPVEVYFSRLERAPWKVLVGVPQAEVEGRVVAALTPVALTGLILLFSSLLAAWLFGRRLTAELVDAARYANAVRGGQAAPKTSPSRITEIRELTETLENASRERSRYEERLKGLIDDKDMLMQEVHHRVKNSLQLVRGVLALQARASEEPATKAALLAAASRILTVADVHQHLYQGHSTIEIHVGRYIQDLASDLHESLLSAQSDRTITVHAPDIIWPSEKVTTLGLILTELVTNAIKHGAGNVTITLVARPDGGGELTVEDEGTGFPQNFELGDGKGLGSRLVTSLIRPEEGSITIDRSAPHGRVVLNFSSSWRSNARM